MVDRIILITPEERLAGPLTADESVVVSILEKGETNQAILRDKAELVRSRFYSALLDLLDLNLVSISMA